MKKQVTHIKQKYALFYNLYVQCFR